MLTKLLLFIILTTSSIEAQNKLVLKMILIGEEQHRDFSLLLKRLAFNLQNKYANLETETDLVLLNHHNEVYSYNKVCSLMENMGVTVFLDMTMTGWEILQDIAKKYNILYFRIDISNLLFIQAMYNYLEHKNSNNALFVLPTELDINMALSYFTKSSTMDLIFITPFDLTPTFFKYLMKINPSTQNFAIIMNSKLISSVFKLFQLNGFVYDFNEWNFLITDFQSDTQFEDFNLNEDMSLLYLHSKICCVIKGYKDDCICSGKSDLPDDILTVSMQYIVKIIYQQFQKSPLEINFIQTNCNDFESQFNASWKESIESTVISDITKSDILSYDKETSLLQLNLILNIVKYISKSKTYVYGNWSTKYGIQVDNHAVIPKLRRFYQVGTIEYVPWAYRKRDEETDELILDDDQQPIWTGYCIEILKDISKALDFDYEIVVPKYGTYGESMKTDTNGIIWNGLIGDLVDETIDMAFAALSFSEEREKVVDFVSPYIGFSGHTLVIRKTYRTTSIFKFMTVLRLEVWLSILGALSVTAILIWALEKLSPYSAKNRKGFYTQPFRDFTLKESFWFALTSFTPQGGGETPKALSGRAIVASYWLFVVLMLATFTANLAAFLTVERMQTPVQSLEQLVRQKLINYTVVSRSSTYRFIENMKNAEEDLYNMWKDLALNLDHDQDQYQVWDYPISELYYPLLDGLYNYGTIGSSKAGFKEVLEHQNSDFILIHDSAEIEYEISKNCNLTTIGQPFGEHPYAIAVKQGSPIQHEIGQLLSEWQKYRYFENLKDKYWNYSVRGECPNSADNEGITLRSLGGVFIATIFGLFVSMCTLGVEVLYLRRKEKKKIENEENTKSTKDQVEEPEK